MSIPRRAPRCASAAKASSASIEASMCSQSPSCARVLSAPFLGFRAPFVYTPGRVYTSSRCAMGSVGSCCRFGLQAAPTAHNLPAQNVRKWSAGSFRNGTALSTNRATASYATCSLHTRVVAASGIARVRSATCRRSECRRVARLRLRSPRLRPPSKGSR